MTEVKDQKIKSLEKINRDLCADIRELERQLAEKEAEAAGEHHSQKKLAETARMLEDYATKTRFESERKTREFVAIAGEYERKISALKVLLGVVSDVDYMVPVGPEATIPDGQLGYLVIAGVPFLPEAVYRGDRWELDCGERPWPEEDILVWIPRRMSMVDPDTKI